MMQCKDFVRTDEYMRFDEVFQRYILTAKCVLDFTGIELATRLNAKGSANEQATLNGFLNRISVLTYQFIADHAINVELRYHVANCCPSARPIMQEAMLAQTLYVLTNGDLTLSADKEKRALWFDKTAETILYRNICETGYSLLYCGA